MSNVHRIAKIERDGVQATLASLPCLFLDADVAPECWRLELQLPSGSLAVVEEMSLEQVALVLDLDVDTVRRHLAQARASLRHEVELPVLIIEDEPMIAIELSQIVREMGMNVSGTAARQELCGCRAKRMRK